LGRSRRPVLQIFLGKPAAGETVVVAAGLL
jgi:hypothetical protein